MQLGFLTSVIVVAVSACGGSPSTEPASTGPAASIIAPRASEADLVVAQVDGRPVWGSCVSEQAARGARDRAEALEQCIAFELLAQAAEKRGLAADASVAESARTAMVSELIEAEFEARYQTPQALGATLDAVLNKNAWRMHRPDLRASAYVRAVVPPSSGPEIEARAKQLADAIATELAGESGLFLAHVRAAADRLAKDTGIEIHSEAVPQTQKTGAYELPYLEALFSIPEIGRVSKPARTKRGWDVVLWSDGLPPKESTREELAQEVFPDLRRAQFTVWINQLIKTSGTKIELDQDTVSRLDEVPQ
ncbi:MAG: hypothetical protein H0T42_00075 [Deltaproteobacteria bacterium]|nr:hypothetical protein [Deltaproteobacteria bacterium]